MAVTLTADEIQAFHDRGYLVLRNVIEEDELDRLRREADRILELIVNSSLANDRTSGRLALAEDDNDVQHVRKVQPVNDLSREIARVSQDDRFLEPMRTLLGDEPVLMEEKLNYKQRLPEPVPGLEARYDSTAFPVHNDWAYYRQDGYPRSLVWSAVCLDDCTDDNGPLHVWPGSHIRHIPHEDRESGLAVPDGEINYNGGTSLCVPAGSIIMCHSLLVHNSRHNDSGHPRRLMIYSHYPESEFNTYFDERNGPTRYEESQWESEYHRKKWAGTYTDTFTLRDD
jgi:ectoine hydroxylase-related dioxygenase (phytanoyl-CoA dioxygenase family)